MRQAWHVGRAGALKMSSLITLFSHMLSKIQELTDSTEESKESQGDFEESHSLFR